VGRVQRLGSSLRVQQQRELHSIWHSNLVLTNVLVSPAPPLYTRNVGERAHCECECDPGNQHTTHKVANVPRY
jgi:hypothetical protein